MGAWLIWSVYENVERADIDGREGVAAKSVGEAAWEREGSSVTLIETGVTEGINPSAGRQYLVALYEVRGAGGFDTGTYQDHLLLNTGKWAEVGPHNDLMCRNVAEAHFGAARDGGDTACWVVGAGEAGEAIYVKNPHGDEWAEYPIGP